MNPKERSRLAVLAQAIRRAPSRYSDLLARAERTPSSPEFAEAIRALRDALERIGEDPTRLVEIADSLINSTRKPLQHMGRALHWAIEQDEAGHDVALNQRI